MAIIAFCEAKLLPKLIDKGIKQVYCAAIQVHSAGMHAGWKGAPLFDYVEIIGNAFYPRSDRNEKFQEVMSNVNKLGKDDIALFYCQYGQSRSYAIATAVAATLNQHTLTRYWLDHKGNLKSSRDWEFDSSISATFILDSVGRQQ